MTLEEEIAKLDLIASDAFEGGDANEFKQLAEWMKELKELRREHTCEECRYSSYGFSDHPCSVCRRGYYPRHSMTDYYEMEVNADAD